MDIPFQEVFDFLFYFLKMNMCNICILLLGNVNGFVNPNVVAI